MKNLPNIDKSAFRRGEYVGYGQGEVWRIHRTGFPYDKWVATAHNNEHKPAVYAPTLTELSRKIS